MGEKLGIKIPESLLFFCFDSEQANNVNVTLCIAIAYESFFHPPTIPEVRPTPELLGTQKLTVSVPA
jgi:hypothetical protein